MLNFSYILEMLSCNSVCSHAIEMRIRLISYATMSSDFFGKALIRTAVTSFRTLKYVKRCYESKIIRTTKRVSLPIVVHFLKK